MPFLHIIKDGLPEEKENFWVTLSNGTMSLKEDHAYYYQVQTQMNVCKLTYCDFVVWTEKGIAIQRIAKDTQFFRVLSQTFNRFSFTVYYRKLSENGTQENRLQNQIPKPQLFLLQMTTRTRE